MVRPLPPARPPAQSRVGGGGAGSSARASGLRGGCSRRPFAAATASAFCRQGGFEGSALQRQLSLQPAVGRGHGEAPPLSPATARPNLISCCQFLTLPVRCAADPVSVRDRPPQPAGLGGGVQAQAEAVGADPELLLHGREVPGLLHHVSSAPFPNPQKVPSALRPPLPTVQALTDSVIPPGAARLSSVTHRPWSRAPAATWFCANRLAVRLG